MTSVAQSLARFAARRLPVPLRIYREIRAETAMWWSRCCALRFRAYPDRRWEPVIAKWFHRKTGNYLSWVNLETLSEKLQWVKIYGPREIMGEYSDKLAVREYVTRVVGPQYLIPLLGQWEKAVDIDFTQLPDKYVLKVNHGSSWNLIVNHASPSDQRYYRRMINWWLNTDFAFINGYELQYRCIKPQVFAESFIGGSEGLVDYKFYCFRGVAQSVMVCQTQPDGNRHYLYFDRDYNLLPLSRDSLNVDPAELPPRPAHYEEMFRVAEQLSAPFSFVRVDLYDTADQVYFGELTFTPASGGDAPRKLPETDQLLGSMLDLEEPYYADGPINQP